MISIPEYRDLASAVERWSEATEIPRGPEALKNLEYAYSAIQPVTHTECAFVVWAGLMELEPIEGIVDEYCRRRRGEPAQFFDHPVLDTGLWGPDTYRVLVFAEQWEIVTLNLTSRTGIAFQTLQGEGSVAGSICHDDFLMLHQSNVGTLPASDVSRLYYAIREGYNRSESYALCSAIVEQSFSLKIKALPV